MNAMEAIVLLVLVALLAVVLVFRFVIVPGYRAVRRHSQADDPWKVVENNESGTTCVYISKTGRVPQLIDKVSLSLPAWQYQEDLESVRIEAEDKASTLNRRLRA